MDEGGQIKELFSVGTEIYYGGDMANPEGFGKVVKAEVTRFGNSVDILMEDGREINGISMCMFSAEYLGHGGTRFVTKGAYKNFREKQLKYMQERYSHIFKK